MNDMIVLAESVRRQCIEAALRAYEDAGISGLCAEGRWEIAIQAMRCLDLDAVLRATDDPESRPNEQFE